MTERVTESTQPAGQTVFGAAGSDGKKTEEVAATPGNPPACARDRSAVLSPRSWTGFLAAVRRPHSRRHDRLFAAILLKGRGGIRSGKRLVSDVPVQPCTVRR